VFIVVSVYFVIDLVRKILDTPMYYTGICTEMPRNLSSTNRVTTNKNIFYVAIGEMFQLTVKIPYYAGIIRPNKLKNQA